MFERKIRWGKGTRLVRVKKDKGPCTINGWSVYFVQDGEEEHVRPVDVYSIMIQVAFIECGFAQEAE